MSMQDITGQYAIPLALPFSDVPPPYGRRRRPFVASRRPTPVVFDLKRARHAAAPASAQAEVASRATKAHRAAKAVRAEDFGSDNRAWVRPHPLRRRWRLTLMACALFGAACIFATHFVDERQHAAGHGAVYEASILVAPTAAVAATEVAQATGRSAEVAIVPADRAASADEQAARAATVAAKTVSAESRAAQAGRASSASAPVAVAMVIASDAVVAEAAAPLAARASPASRKPVAVAARAAAKPAATLRGKKARNVAPNAATASREATLHAQPAARVAAPPAVAPVSSSAQAVGMTAAEFTQWLAVTRDTSRPAAGGTDLSVDLPSHTRLIGR
ncbi:serine protease [Burkholderia seminalis]|uniref:serine protease n=1 Tax=Burkholderia seminalis TaxID=488731 RepID=UPI001903C9EB|nr:serine protease [Burkholderia seminalis]MBJ9963444.1 serine protease [Burkholderia seminalis]